MTEPCSAPSRKRTRRRWLIGLLVGAAVLAALSPFIWGLYHWIAGRAAMNRYHTPDARVHLNACLRLWPWSRSAGTYLLAARAARRDGDFGAASDLLHECQVHLGGEEWSEATLEHALLRACIGDLDSVERHLRERYYKDPEHAPLILEALSEGCLRMARLTDALLCVEEWLRSQPNNTLALSHRGRINHQVGASRKCVEDYSRILELDPDFPQARWWLALSLREIGRYAEAVEHLEYLRRRQPDDLELLVRLAIGYRDLGQTPQANALLDRVLAVDPANGLALRTRGEIAKVNGQLAEAEKWLTQALHAMPYDLRTNSLLADCLKAEGKTEEAEKQLARKEKISERLQRRSRIITRDMAKDSHNPALHCELGELDIQLGHPEAGESWLLSALRLNENYLPALKALADYYQQRGESEKAEEYRRRAQSATKR